jgi:hypothetical protein
VQRAYRCLLARSVSRLLEGENIPRFGAGYLLEIECQFRRLAIVPSEGGRAGSRLSGIEGGEKLPSVR